MLTLSIVTPDRRVVGPVKVLSATIPAGNGAMTVLPGHARLVSIVMTGPVAFEEEGGKKNYAAVSHGFVEVEEDQVTLLADTFELAHEIDVERAKRAQEKAEAELKAKQEFDDNMTKWQRKLERALIRQQVSQFLLPPH